MNRLLVGRSRRSGVVLALTATLLAAGLYGVAAPRPALAGAATHSGTVDVLYAGSLFDAMQQRIDPAFHAATGYSVSGFSNGSDALASEIRGRTQVADVFISASPSVNASLAGAANGSWVNSYDVFGSSTLVLGYNPSSSFASALRHQPWYDVVTRPHFRLGRTDPATDPKGVLAVDALRGVALSYAKPSLNALATSSSNIFDETALVGQLQAGQLDAGFFYRVEADSAHLSTAPLVGTSLAGLYTVALVHGAPHGAAARAFVSFLLSASGRRLLSEAGVTPIVPAKVVAVR